jgi:hypothetical protein
MSRMSHCEDAVVALSVGTVIVMGNVFPERLVDASLIAALAFGAVLEPGNYVGVQPDVDCRFGALFLLASASPVSLQDMGHGFVRWFGAAEPFIAQLERIRVVRDSGVDSGILFRTWDYDFSFVVQHS